MSDQRDQKGRKEYSVDEILAEYGSGNYGKSKKVVEFPEGRSAPPKNETRLNMRV